MAFQLPAFPRGPSVLPAVLGLTRPDVDEQGSYGKDPTGRREHKFPTGQLRWGVRPSL